MTDSRSSPIQIPKKYVKSNYSFNAPPSDFTKMLFELEIKINDKIKTFRNFEESKWTNFININDKILYKELGDFKVSITKIPSVENSTQTFKNKINKNQNSYSTKENDIYIEFTKNDIGYTICNCYYVGINFTDMFISPPN